MPADVELLRRYAENRSEEAFAELVQQHIDLVYFAAFRRLGGDRQLAEDVCQQVFVALARNASSLSHHSTITGWLYSTARHKAVSAVRSERRRRIREREAQLMRDIDANSTSADWDKMRPVLDTALDELSIRDREAVLLRFFRGQSFAEVGESLSITADAARMRVERALDKLRAGLNRRGVSSTTAVLALVFANQATAAAPPGLGASVAATALAGALKGGGGLTLSQVFSLGKIQTGVVGAIVLAGAAAAIVEVRNHEALADTFNSLQTENGELRQLKVENQRLHEALDQEDGPNREIKQLARLQARVARLRARPAGVTDSAMKPAGAWRNAGIATPEAALETLMWAEAAHDQKVRDQVLCRLSADSMAIVAGFFATLSDAARAKFVTPGHWLRAVVSNLSRNPADPVVAYQVFDQRNHDGPDEVRVSYWQEQASQQEQEANTVFQRLADGWHRKPPDATARGWQGIFSRIDPATGEFREGAR